MFHSCCILSVRPFFILSLSSLISLKSGENQNEIRSYLMLGDQSVMLKRERERDKDSRYMESEERLPNLRDDPHIKTEIRGEY